MYDNELMHYGVLGMKWGVRRNKAKAYQKSVKKLNRIRDKVNKRQKAANDAFDRAERKSQGLFSNPKKSARAFDNAVKYQTKADRMQNKGIKWYKRMEQEFSKVDVNIDSKSAKLGQQWLEDQRRRSQMLKSQAIYRRVKG